MFTQIAGSAEVHGEALAASSRPARLLEFDAVLACPVCGAGDRDRDVRVLSDALHGVPGTFQYARCRSCRSTYQTPRVAEACLNACYPDDYFTHSQFADPVPRAGAIRRFRELVLRGARSSRGDGVGWAVRALAVLAQRVPAVRRRVQVGLPDAVDAVRNCGTSLEIGPGSGMDMWRMAELGWTAEGLDIDPAAAGLAASRSGCPVHVGPLNTFRPNRRFDLVYSCHSLEHLPHLAHALRDVFELLNSQGKVVVIVPNPTSLVARVYRDASPAWDPPRHLVLATPHALAAALRVAGYRNVRVSTTARSASTYSSVAASRRGGAVGTAAWAGAPTVMSRVVAAAERILVRAGLPVGEEIIATGELA